MSDTVEDPFGAEADASDPFATPEDVQTGGVFIPRPKVEHIEGRLVALIPRKYDEAAKVSEYAQKKYGMKPEQEVWYADLFVLDGPVPFTFTYLSKRENGGEDDYEEKEATVEALPAAFPGWRVTWGNVIGVLNKLSGTARPVALGRLRAGYPVAEMRKGKTFEQFAKEREAYYASPRGKKEPKAVWHFEAASTPEDRAVALTWWKSAGITI